MTTPVADFVRAYAAADPLRLHTPGHKGRGPLGCEPWDITEIAGADSLFEASGILRQSEENAASLFGAAHTFYSAEGASLCLRAMVYLAVTVRPEGTEPFFLAARNMHRSFLYAAALTDTEIRWLRPEEEESLCACKITPAGLKKALDDTKGVPAAVFVTSPDYLGGEPDIAGLAAVCRDRGTVLMVDGAHGAYLHFLPGSPAPQDRGAALCCASAHKTLPVLTGGAYLHVGRTAPARYAAAARGALALFGSTSPSYLILASLDLCNRRLAGDYPARLADTAVRAEALRRALSSRGWEVLPSDPLRVTVRENDRGELAARLRGAGAEPELASPEHVVLMLTPENDPAALERLPEALGENRRPCPKPPPLVICEAVRTPRQALFSPKETIPISRAAGRICAAPTASCPPGVPAAIPGERLSPGALALLAHYGTREVEVLL